MREQCCWMHKSGNVLNSLPKVVMAKAKSDLHEIWMAPTWKDAEMSFDRFLVTYGLKYSKSAHCLLKDRERLLTFYDFPAKHWINIRTSNVIESSFGTIRKRTQTAKGCGFRTTMFAMMFKLAIGAMRIFRRYKGRALLARIVSGSVFTDGLEPRRQAVAV